MSEFKQRADLRNAQLKTLLLELEQKRDLLLDEVATKKGQVGELEQTIRRCYEMILEVNKEEQKKEFESLSRGMKTPKTAKARPTKH